MDLPSETQRVGQILFYFELYKGYYISVKNTHNYVYKVWGIGLCLLGKRKTFVINRHVRMGYVNCFE